MSHGAVRTENSSSQWSRQVAKVGKTMMRTGMWLRSMFITYNILGRLRMRRENGIKMNLSKTGCESGAVFISPLWDQKYM
jgi:hypothetical protein